jgi:flagellar basal body rod protein FlgB
MAMELFDPTITALERSAASSIKKSEVINQNIANISNPDYKAKTFDDVLGKAVERQDRKQVVLEEEMAEMSKNSGRYSAYLKLLASKFGVLRTVISQGRR